MLSELPVQDKREKYTNLIWFELSYKDQILDRKKSKECESDDKILGCLLSLVLMQKELNKTKQNLSICIKSRLLAHICEPKSYHRQLFSFNS